MQKTQTVRGELAWEWPIRSLLHLAVLSRAQAFPAEKVTLLPA